MTAIPRTAAEFTTDWMNEVLAPHLNTETGKGRVVSCQATDSPIPGQTAEIILIAIETEGTSLPERLVAKVTSQNPIVLEQVIANYDQYRRETSFYREFPEVGIAVPEVYYLDFKAESQEFIILMGDLAPSVSPSWAIEPDQVVMALNSLPAFHGRWWNDPKLLEKDWLVQRSNTPFYAAAFGAAHQAAEAINEHYQDAETTNALMALVDEKLSRVLAFIESRPFTFVHGDYHSKQMFFPTDEGGNFAVIDWQFPFVAPGAWDFARMTGMCLDTAVRREKEKQLLESYHSGLVANGVAGYSQQDLEDDYRIGLLVSQMIMCVAHGNTDVALFVAECGDLGVDWQDVMLMRTQRAIEDWQVLEFVESL